MALRTFLKTLGESGLPGAMSLSGLKALPLFLQRGLHPTLILPTHSFNFPDKPAVSDTNVDYTYGEFKTRVCKLGTGLLAGGVQAHDGLLVMLPNGVPYLETLMACTASGITSVLAPNRSTSEELTYLAEDSKAQWLIADARYGDVISGAHLPHIPESHRFIVNGPAPDGWSTLEEVAARGVDKLPPLPPSRSAHNIIYTSGTTGKPKGAKRDMARAGLGPLMDFLQCIPFRHSDMHLACCPLYHSTGMGLAQVHLLLGASVVIMEHFEPEAWLKLVQEKRASSVVIVPTMIHDLITLPDEVFNQYDVSSVRIMMTTGAPLTLAQRQKVRERFGDVLYDMYGSTEWGWLTVAQPRDHVERPGTIGRVVPGGQIRIVDDDHHPVPQGEVGELFAKTRLQIDEYHNRADATRSALMADGFLSVGDMVRQDADGYLYIADRKSDMVISGGVNLYPPEIEAALSLHPAIEDIAVIGVPDERWGEKLLAWIVLRPDQAASEDEIIDFAREHLTGAKIPRLFRFIDSIPKSPTGKIRKRDLKQRYLAETEQTDGA